MRRPAAHLGHREPASRAPPTPDSAQMARAKELQQQLDEIQRLKARLALGEELPSDDLKRLEREAHAAGEGDVGGRARA